MKIASVNEFRPIISYVSLHTILLPTEILTNMIRAPENVGNGNEKVVDIRLLIHFETFFNKNGGQLKIVAHSIIYGTCDIN